MNHPGITRRSIYLPGPATVDSLQHHLVPDAAVRGNMLFTGGIAGFDAQGALPETHEDQALRVYDRIGAILDESGFSWDDVGHWFIWAPDRHSKIAPVNPHWERIFPNAQSRPARHALSRQLDPGMQYRIEIIGVKDAPRRAFEINDRVYHTGGTTTPGFMPFGTTMGDVVFTGPTYGMYAADRKMGETADKQAELCDLSNREFYALAGATPDNLAQMFVWYHDTESRAAAIRYTDVMFPDPGDRPAIHYIHSPLPFWKEVEGQFLIQYDIIGVRGQRRKTIDVPGVRPMDGEGGKVPAGVAMGNLLFTSVILGHDARSGALPSSVEEQTTNAFANARAVVEAGGFAFADTGHAYVWYADHAVRETVDNVWAKVFPQPEDRPARHCVVADLPAGSLVGVELTAVR